MILHDFKDFIRLYRFKGFQKFLWNSMIQKKSDHYAKLKKKIDDYARLNVDHDSMIR